MKLHKKALLIPTCLSFLTASSQAALVLEFREVGENRVELSFSGKVDIAAAGSRNFREAENSSDYVADVIGASGLSNRSYSYRGKVTNVEFYRGSDLLPETFADINIASMNKSLGFDVYGPSLNVTSDLIAGLSGVNNEPDVSVLSGEIGGVLYGKSQLWITTFAASGLDRHIGKGRVDLWKVTGSENADHLIQFHVIPSPVPEPSSILLTGIGLLTLTVRRKRNEHTCKAGRNET